MNPLSVDALIQSPLVQVDLVGLAGIVVWHLIPRRRPNTRLVVQIVFFLVMTALLVGNDIAPHRLEGEEAEDLTAYLVVSANCSGGFHLAWAVIGFVRIYLIVGGGAREARLAPGDFFGETGLLAGLGEAFTLEALTRVTVYEIDQQAFAPLLAHRPAMAEDLALSLSKRAQQVPADAPRGPHQDRSVRAFLRSIQAVFHH